MCVVRGGNVTPGPLTRGPGRVSGYPSEGRMPPPPYAGHQLAACTHAPCAPCAPRSQVHVLGAPVSYMQTHICKVCNRMHIFYFHFQKYALGLSEIGAEGQKVQKSKLLTFFLL